MPQKIVIDTDPGIDDAVAILLALAAPEELEVLGLAAVAGNVPLSLAERNARALCELAGCEDMPVYAGCPRPMRRTLTTAEHVHGGSGLGRLMLALPRQALRAVHGVDFLIETVLREAPHSVTLCTLGPLTNVAAALVKAPTIAGRIKEVVMMGGASRALGNITPAAEFNIFVDPEAAAIVMQCGAPVTVIPLDATHQALAAPAHVERIRAIGNRCGAAVAQLLTPAADRASRRFGDGGLPLHDPCVIAYLLRPDLFEGSTVNVMVETASPLTQGMTVVDWWGVSGRPPNARVIHAVDAEGFFGLLTERLALLP